MRDVHEEGWKEEVEEKSSLKWYRLDKEDFGQERFASKGEVRLRFRLQMVSAGLLGDKERCGKCKDGKCSYVMKVLWKMYISCCTGRV